MRPFILAGALAGALVASPGAAQGGQQQAGASSDEHPSKAESASDMKGYGYGEQPGKSGTAAKQEAGEARPRSKAPQDERASSGSDKGSSGSKGSATGVDSTALSGEVVKVGARSLSLRSDDQRVHRLRLDENTRVLREGREISIGDLQAGEEVRAAFDTRRGRRVATTITLTGGEAGEPPSHGDKARESERRQSGGSAGQDR